jgi:DNA-binding SARP family transcriptional activator/DNA-binding beta-propeller fold protein YncE
MPCQRRMPLAISILGPIDVVRDGRHVDLGSPQQRALLALLALRPGAYVPLDAIIDALWPDDPPASAAKVVQTYISRLRKALGAEVIDLRDGGYALSVPREAVDAARFEDLLTAGRATEALSLWRGPPLAGARALKSDRLRLDEMRRRAVEDRLDDELEQGRHAEVVAQARDLLAEDPLRERALGQLMVGLYRCGRQADALEVYRDARRTYHSELGLEPGPALRELERRILAHDPSLAPAPPDVPAMLDPTSRPLRVRPRRLRVVVAAVIAAVTATLVAIVVVARTSDEQTRIVVRPHTIVRIDTETNEIVDSIPVGREPAAIVASPDAVWVANERDATLARVDLRTREVRMIGGVEDVAFLTRDNRGNVYASAWDHPYVWRIDPRTVEVAERYRVRTRALGLAVGGGSLWVVDRLANAVVRIDLARGSVRDVIPVGRDPLLIVFGYGALWVANSDSGSVSAIRPGVPGLETIEGIPRPFGIAAGEGAVWVGSNTGSTVTRIEPDTRRKIAEIDVRGEAPYGSGLFGVATGAGSVWALNRITREVVRIDPRTNEVVARIPLGPGVEPRTLHVAGDAVWLSVGTPGFAG